MREKTFSKDLELIAQRLKNHEIFAFSKYADGEYEILKNRPITNCDGWTFNPQFDKTSQQRLMESFQYKNPSYFVGVNCPCCAGQTIADDMKLMSNQESNNLTWANIFVNGNYRAYLKTILPLYSEYKVYLVANERSKLKYLPFDVEKFYPIGDLAWKKDYDLIEKIKKDITANDIKGALFLFCAGPLGNMLAHQLFEHNSNNTYLDIGSTLNVHLLGPQGKNRGYLRGESTSQKVCRWE
ncbi:MAG TPA: hypothetical protein EYN67_08775 [Flavobacteriales bacterium]|nr:hypothetical protein [Flavobacteriales bacterium]